MRLILLGMICFIRCAHAGVDIEMPAGQYPVGTTQLVVAKQFENIGNHALEQYLKGARSMVKGAMYLDEILAEPEYTPIVNVQVPANKIFGPHAGETLPLVLFVAYPTTTDNPRAEYVFPYTAVERHKLPHMQRREDKPLLADAHKKYPLIILSHGRSGHTAYDFANAIKLASHGYIVAGLFYGDDRLKSGEKFDRYRHYLRPFMTSQAIDYLLAHKDLKQFIDEKKIGASGHSFGGFTILALAGGDVFGEGNSVRDPKIKAGLVSAPWLGGRYFLQKVYAFGDENKSLEKVQIPLLGLFGTKDKVAHKSYILPALAQTKGPRYVVELVDQPHVYEPESWQDQEHWGLLFFDAYLKDNKDSMELLSKAEKAKGGNKDRQLFEYQN